MKLQNLSVIFVIIVLPLILLLSYYISLQADTINLQTAYNSKLLDSTKEAIDAFEINTVQWNANYSETADSKRRDVMASINTFITSFSNNIGIGGTSRENILSYMPAIVYTLYDGYYIYSPAEVKPTIKDGNGVAVTMNSKLCENGTITGYVYNEDDKGKLLYESAAGHAMGQYNGQEFTLNPEDAADTDFTHVLKPYAPYSEQLPGTNMVINYTLDNYITLYGEVDEDGDGTDEYVSKSGYLTYGNNIKDIQKNTINGIKFYERTVEPEVLEETIAYTDTDATGMQKGTFIYVYEAEGNTKVYYDDTSTRVDSEGNRIYFFRLDQNNKRIWLDQLTEPLYKKCTVPGFMSGQWTHLKLYQNLINGNWYRVDNTTGNYELRFQRGIDTITYGGVTYNLWQDYSAVNYCVESYLFSLWYNDVISDAGLGNTVYDISATNNDPELKTSIFSDHKREIIKGIVNLDLQQSISSYSRNTPNEYRIPEIREEDWDQVLRNASIITFIQNIPIGMKYYNDYAIATSTVNKEYVDPNEIYLNASDGTLPTYYHTPYCNNLGTNNLIGYRSIDYIQKSYEIRNAITNITDTRYYYRHDNNTNTHIDVEEACYNCLIQRSEYTENKTNEKEDAYYTALARERYVARMAKLPPEVEPSYYLHVEMVLESNPTETVPMGEASYTIDGTRWTEASRTKIQKTVPKTYEIRAENAGAGGAVDPTVTTDVGSLDTPKATILTELTEFPTYISDPASEIDVTINTYNYSGIYTTYDNKTNVDWGSGDNENIYDMPTNPDFISSDVGTGYINVRLKYEPNYVVDESTKGVEAWANINDYNSLTIVAETKGISGEVRLKFENNGVIYYSENTFDITNGAKIYCKIPRDGLPDGATNWYTKDWTVYVLKTNNDEIVRSDGTMKYYTINTTQGITGFARAVNEGAKTQGRTFKLLQSLNVGTMTPIGALNSYPFKGIFEGVESEYAPYTAKVQTITGMNITPDSTVTYNNFGLFGKVASGATVKNITVNNATINLANLKAKQNGNYKTGGIAGENNGTLENVNVSNSTIKGTAYVGGIVGNTTSKISGSTVSNSVVQSLGNYTNGKRNDICIGGIAGYSTAPITSCTFTGNNVAYAGIDNHENWRLDSPEIGDNDLTMKIGGIAGHASSSITNCKVEKETIIGTSNVDFERDEDYNTKLFYNGSIIDKNYSDVDYYVGGYVGYLDGQINFDSTIVTLENMQINGGLYVENTSTSNGFADDNCKSYTGGLVGCNNKSEIKNIINRSSVSSSGYTAGGIVGINKGKNIHDCKNYGIVSGLGNVGGIVGWTERGWIYLCENNANLQANKNMNSPIIDGGDMIDGASGAILNDVLKFLENLNMWWYNTASDTCTGVGGIAGKANTATIDRCGNLGKITGNYNVGGISGISDTITVKYCFNGKNAIIKSTEFGRVRWNLWSYLWINII